GIFTKNTVANVLYILSLHDALPIYDQSDQQGSQDGKGHAAYARRQFEYKHYLISSKGAKPLEIKLLDTYLTKDDGFTAAFNTLQTMPTAKAKPRTVFYFKQFINSFA